MEKITGLTGSALGILLYFNQAGIGLRPEKDNPKGGPPAGQDGAGTQFISSLIASWPPKTAQTQAQSGSGANKN